MTAKKKAIMRPILVPMKQRLVTLKELYKYQGRGDLNGWICKAHSGTCDFGSRGW